MEYFWNWNFGTNVNIFLERTLIFAALKNRQETRGVLQKNVSFNFVNLKGFFTFHINLQITDKT